MRYFIELSYSGKNYFGWQIQPNQITVQEVLENALSTLLRSDIKIMGAGRTDTGVHAQQMFAHFDFHEPINDKLTYRLNAYLPKDIAIKRIFKVSDSAHARFDATERTYHYFISLEKNPFLIDSHWQIDLNLDVDLMNSAAELLLKHRDFSSFAKTHTDVKTHICDVKKAFWIQEGKRLKFNITADRFLRNMVRAIVGTLVEVGKGKVTPEEFNSIVLNKNRGLAGASAPAHGLFLVAIEYEFL